MSITYPNFRKRLVENFTSVFGWHVLKWKFDFGKNGMAFFVFKKGLFVVIIVQEVSSIFILFYFEYFCFIFGSKVKIIMLKSDFFFLLGIIIFWFFHL
jgi:hypothetical protein